MALLEVEGLRVGYGFPVLMGISFEVEEGETAVLFGLNGAGKTTTVATVAGMLKPDAGSIRFMGEEIGGRAPAKLVSMGVALAPEGRRVFPSLSVANNLRLGAWTRRSKTKEVAESQELVFDYFPRLAERVDQAAGTLSGGEQQMLAIGRALMTSPKLLILDEPSLGLAPLLVQQIREIIVDINQQGTSVLLIEQNATMALSIAETGYIMETGKIVMDGPAEKLLKDDDVKEFYLGLHGDADGDRKSFREVKHYKRRKRWLS